MRTAFALVLCALAVSLAGCADKDKDGPRCPTCPTPPVATAPTAPAPTPTPPTTTPPPTPTCTYVITRGVSLPAVNAGGGIAVGASAGCTWSASTTCGWVALKQGSNFGPSWPGNVARGTGNGNFFASLGNNVGAARSCDIVFLDGNGREVGKYTITQAGR